MTDFPSAVGADRSADAAASLADVQLRRDAVRFRVAAGLLIVGAAATGAWLLPWIPLGMRESDYSARSTISVVVLALLGAGCTSFAARWAPLLQHEPFSEFVKVLMGQSMLVRSRARFLRRLETQCERTRDQRAAGFSLLVLDLPGIDRQRPDDEARFSRWVETVRNIVRAQDVVGDSGEDEIWLLLQGAGPDGCAGVAGRIQQSNPMPPARDRGGLECRIGHATFGLDGRDPDMLFRVARLAADRAVDRLDAA